jgi:hypothetical protein
MTKIKQLAIVMVFLCALFKAQETNAQFFKWVEGTDDLGNVLATKMAKDKWGNSIITGQYLSRTDLNFNTGTNDTSYAAANPAGGIAAFFARYDAMGKFKWAKKLYNNEINASLDISKTATDDSGNVYISGNFTGVVDFNASDLAADTAIEYSYSLSGFYLASMYVAKYDSTGNFKWVMNLTGGVPILRDLTLRNGRIYLTGSLMSLPEGQGYEPVNTDFNASKLAADTFTLNGGSFETNCFFGVYDLNAKLLKVKRMLGVDPNDGWEIDADTGYNIYVTGSLRGRHDLNTSEVDADTFFLTAARGTFLAKYDSAGKFIWGQPVLENDNISGDNMSLLEVTNSAEVYVAGAFGGVADFDPGSAAADTLNLTASGTSSSVYLAHYSRSGSMIDAFTTGSLNGVTEKIVAIASDDSNQVYIAGDFMGKVDFDLRRNVDDTLYLNSAGTLGNPDMFFAKYSVADSLLWARKIGNADFQNLTGMDVAQNQVTLYGGFVGDVVFDPNPPLNAASKLIGGGVFLSTYRTYPPSAEKKLLSYKFVSPAVTGTIINDTVKLTVSASTDVTNLIADFQVSKNAIALIGSIMQVSTVTPNDFSNVVTYTVMAEDSSTKDYYVKVEFSLGVSQLTATDNGFVVWPNPAKDIVYFEKPFHVVLYNANGQLLREEKNATSISLKGITPGIYFLSNEFGQKQTIIIR